MRVNWVIFVCYCLIEHKRKEESAFVCVCVCVGRTVDEVCVVGEGEGRCLNPERGMVCVCGGVCWCVGRERNRHGPRLDLYN